MNMPELWDRARKQTEILRMRLQDLATFDATIVPYVFLAESSLNQGDTVVRRGNIVIQRPAIVLPDFTPQFQGFEFEKDFHVGEDAVATFLLLRGVHFPSLKYRHQISSLDLYEGQLARAIEHFQDQLTRAEDIKTGLVVGPEEAWQFSVLLLVGALVVRSSEGDLRRIIDAWRKRQQS